MTGRRTLVIGPATAFVVAAALSCAGPERATRPGAGGTPALLSADASGSGLLVCPGNVRRSASGLVTPEEGGTVAVGGFSITLPAGAVLEPHVLTLTVPESRYLEVDFRIDGREHFAFEAPAVVTLDYSRCGVSTSELGQLTAWYIDSQTKALLEHMGGVDDRQSRRITFVTPHLSGYSIATRTEPPPDDGTTSGE